MEISSILLAPVVLTTIIAYLLKILYASKFIQPTIPSPRGCQLPPGNKGLPLVWESLVFVLHMWRGTPERFIQGCIRRYESCTFKTKFFLDPMMVMHGAEGNKFLFRNEGRLVKTWWPETVHELFARSFFSEVRFKDRPASLLLKAVRLQNYVGIMDTIAQQHLQAKWQPHKQVTVYALAKNYALTLACRLFLSTEDADFIEEMSSPLTAVVEGFACMPINLPWTRFGRAIRATKVIKTRLEAVIRKRRQELEEADLNYKDMASKQDIISCMLLSAEESGVYISDDEVAEWVMGILLASRDTSSVVITLLCKYIGENPQIYQKVLQEQMEIANNKSTGESLNWHDISNMKYSWNVAQEVMRINPPGQAVFREAVSDFTYAGYQVQKGWKIHLSIHATHRDSNYFPSPEKFDPSRFEKDGPLPFTFVPFGGGPNMCPGMNYAKLQILVFLHNVVKKFKWENIIPDEDIIINSFPMPTKGLPIRLHPHQTHL